MPHLVQHVGDEIGALGALLPRLKRRDAAPACETGLRVLPAPGKACDECTDHDEQDGDHCDGNRAGARPAIIIAVTCGSAIRGPGLCGGEGRGSIVGAACGVWGCGRRQMCGGTLCAARVPGSGAGARPNLLR